MKKVLFASTALVAAGLMTAGTADAAEKIKLNLGGFSKWWVVGAWQEDSFQKNTGTGAGTDYANVDIKGDNEIYFGGSTTLDNGMKVGVQVELEAGGHSDASSDTIDESYMFVETGFGKFIVGSENNGTYLLHVQAPDAAGNWGEGGVITSNAAVVRPAQVSLMGISRLSTNTNAQANTTAIVTDGDADKITYVAPTFYGLTVGGSYVPNATSEDNRNAVQEVAAYGAGALYANTFGGVGLKVSAGWVTYDAGNALQGGDDVNEYSAGAQLSYAGFTLGGSYRQVNDNFSGSNTVSAPNSTTIVTTDSTGSAFDIGLQYASGPWAVSAAYFRSEVEGLVANKDDDVVEVYQVSAKYALGPGVDVLATIGHIEYDDESADTVANAANHNKGWAVMTGMGLAF